MTPEDRETAAAEDRQADEREQTVMVAASAHGLRVVLHSLLVLALITALLGNWLIPAALLAVSILAGRLVRDYAWQRHVDADWLTAHSGPLLTRSREGAYVVLMTTAVLGAMSFVGFTGNGLVPVPEIAATGPGADAILRAGAQSAPLGLIVGIVGSEIAAAVKQRRSG